MRVLLATVLVCVVAVAPARATVIPSLSLSTSTTQAGADPDVTVTATFASRDGDTPKDATIALASGLIANAGAAPRCSAEQFQADACPPSSQIGAGSIVATVLGETLPLPLAVYVLTPQGSELGQIGVVVNFFDSPVDFLTVPVELRTSPDVGLEIPITGIPNQIQGAAVQVNALQITLFGSNSAGAFMRNPTSCTAATSSVTVSSYAAPSTFVSADASFIPTGCGSLRYHPQLAGTATVSAGDTGVAFAASIAQGPTEAATRTVTMRLPSGLVPRLSALAMACTSTDLTACPPVGSATVTTPLSGSPLRGNLILAGHLHSLPTIEAIFPPPFAVLTQATLSVDAGRLAATFNGIPDIPITDLVIAFPGGPSSLLVAGPDLCAHPGVVSGDFTAQNDAIGDDTRPLTVVGSCPSVGEGLGGGGVGRGVGRGSTARPPSTHLTLSGLSGRSPRLALSVLAGRNEPGLKVLKIRVPNGLSLHRVKPTSGVTVKLGGHAHIKTVRIANRMLTVSLRDNTRVAGIGLTKPALRVTRSLATRIRRHKLIHLTVLVTVIDTNGRETRLRVIATTRDAS